MFFNLKKNTISIILSLSLLGSALVGTGVANYAANLNRKNDHKADNYAHLMMKTYDGLPLILPIKKGQPIGVVLNGFNENERKIAEKAIKELDNISTTIDYVILEKDIPMNQKLYINNNVELKHAYGEAKVSYSEKTGYLNYPLTVSLAPDLENKFSTNGSCLLSFIIKHELMHTLGFRDLYDKSEMNKSIMYYTPHELEDFTPRDRQAIQDLYDLKEVSTTLPQPLMYSYDCNLNDKFKDDSLDQEDENYL